MGSGSPSPSHILAAETLSYFLSRTQEIHIRTSATYSRTQALNAQNPALSSLMWQANGAAIGTRYFSNTSAESDQFMVTREIARVRGEIRVIDGSVQVERFPEMVSDGSYTPCPNASGARRRIRVTTRKASAIIFRSA